MCGISGIVGAGHHDAIVPMTEALRHRGPDGTGYHRDASAALGHTRLSIIDLEGGQQPITSPDGNLVLVCNGEIYNSPALREEHRRAGYAFKTRTDVEVILPLYERYGEACVDHLRGMFAFAIWDVRRQILFLARDHIGQKPLHYGRAGSSFLFASEPKAILASGLIAPEPDLDAIWHSMSLRFVPDDRSLFKSIKKLEAGHTLTYSVKSGASDLRSYWTPTFEPKHTGTESEMLDRLEAVLREAVDVHLLSDVRVGAFLSGGIDSGLVSAMISTSMGAGVPSFTIGMRDAAFDESEQARRVVEKYSMEGHFREASASLIEMTPAMIRAMDEPADPFGAGVYMASKLASEHVKVVLTGDGGDESFAGYDRFSGQRLVEHYCLLPAWLRRSVIERATKMIPESFAYKSLAQKAAWMNAMAGVPRGDRYVHSLSFLRFTDESKESLWSDSAKAQRGDADSSEKILRYFDADTAVDVVDRMLFTDMKTRLPDHLLATCDRMSMAHSLEARPVLVDREFIEFSARLPTRYKLRGMKLKYLLRRLAERYLPRELVHRRKQGFAFPIGRWLRDDLATFTASLLAESRFVQQGIFNQAPMDRMFSEHRAGKADHNYRLWMLINLELWYRMYFEGASIDDIRELTLRLGYRGTPSCPVTVT